MLFSFSSLNPFQYLVLNIYNLCIFITKIQDRMRLSLVRINRYFSQSTKPVTLCFEEDKKVAKISLTNPKKRNPLSLQVIKLLKNSLSQVQTKANQKKAKIIIFEGEGPVFCSGHDLKQLANSKNPQEIFDQCAQLMLKIRNLSIPTLCVVNGIAAAAGFQLALACDLVVATQKSFFSTPGVKWGLFCSTPAVELIRSISSEKKAMQMLLLGQQITATQAFNYGLLNKVVAEAKLGQTVGQYVSKINNLSGQVISHGKSILRSQRGQDIEKAYCIAGKGMNDNIKAKQDCKQGLKAFSQKRHPHFKN